MVLARGLRAFNRDDSGLRGAFPSTDTVVVFLKRAIVLCREGCAVCPELARWMAIYPLGLGY
jgi:hypothetical protein